MEYIKLDKKAITSWRMNRVLRLPLWLLLCGGIFAGGIFLPWRLVLQITAVALFLYKIIGAVIYPAIEYKQWGYMIREDKVDIRHGIFFVRHSIIPVIRIQHITVSQGPVNRKLGLYSVEMALASNEFEIPCLSAEVAEEIADNLKSRLYNRLEEKGQEIR